MTTPRLSPQGKAQAAFGIGLLLALLSVPFADDLARLLVDLGVAGRGAAPHNVRVLWLASATLLPLTVAIGSTLRRGWLMPLGYCVGLLPVLPLLGGRRLAFERNIDADPQASVGATFLVVALLLVCTIVPVVAVNLARPVRPEGG
ncbi:hypothetical protein [Nocardioides montaniterrae]